MKCIIIDDEPLAIDVVKSYCEAVGSLQVLKTFSSAIDALNFLNANPKIDLVFSDIEMPNFSGVDLIKSLSSNNIPHIIFTTAYPQYALEGYDLNVIDYLVKPIPFPRFVRAVNKVKALNIKNQTNSIVHTVSAMGEQLSGDNFIFVKSEYEHIKMTLADILYIQGLKDYLKIFIVGKSPVLTLMNFKDMLTKLPENNFLRIHRSYIVNIDKIKSIQKNKVIIDNNRLPIGESFKSIVYERFSI